MSYDYEKHCIYCGEIISKQSVYCPKCGKKQEENSNGAFHYKGEGFDNSNTAYSEKSGFIALLLCCLGFAGVSGIHRFYAGKIATGIVWLLTLGVFGFGTIVDIILIVTSNFKDSKGNTLTIG